MNKKTKYITSAAMIAALYVVLTYLSSLFGLSSGAIQVRLSEALCVMPYFTSAAIPGLFVGCLLANLLTGGCVLDLIFGSIATLLGAVIARYLRKHEFLIPIPTILANALIVPLVLIYGYGIIMPYLYLFLTVGAGEVISCLVFGLLLLKVLKRIPYLQEVKRSEEE